VRVRARFRVRVRVRVRVRIRVMVRVRVRVRVSQRTAPRPSCMWPHSQRRGFSAARSTDARSTWLGLG